ncbi:hypothetical protein HY417_04240 [Candidatus Kaiserbacteria bacterium]|nr:hypothetical protein [Candidatus Kaiserbacteria bacterium]
MDDAKKAASGNTAAESSAIVTDPARNVVSSGAGDKKTAADSGDASKAPPEARPVRETAAQISVTSPATPNANEDLSNGARIVEETIVAPAPPPQDIAPQPEVATPLPPPPPVVPLQPPIPAPNVAAPPSPSQGAPPALAPVPHSKAEFAKEQEVIAKILKEAKLPEERGAPVAQKPQTAFDTRLAPHQDQPIPAVHTDVDGPRASALSEQHPPNEIVGAGQGAPQIEKEKRPGLAATIVAPLRTLKDDLQGAVRLKKISLVRAVALEEEKRHHPSDEERMKEETSVRRSRRTLGILFTVAVFVALGGAAFFGVFIVMEERGSGGSGVPQSAILFAESGVPLALEGNALELKRLLTNARLSGSGTLGSITRIIPTVPETSPEGITSERGATLQEFLRALGTRVPDELLRALSQDFFFGLHTVDENAPLFIIPVVSYERAFAGMLTWEETLSADLSPVFTPVLDQVIGSGGLPEKRRFEDVVMRNYDVRVLKDDAGTIELYYSFPTRALLIIAESPYSFTEILSRLRAERKL